MYEKMTKELFATVIKSRSFVPNLCITKYRMGKYEYNTYFLKGSGFQYHYMHPDFVNYVLNGPNTLMTLTFAHAIEDEYLKFLRHINKNYAVRWKLDAKSKHAYSISDFPF